MKKYLKLKAYDFPLPKELIAQKPTIPSDNCKILITENLKPLKLKNEVFKNIPNYLKGNEIFFFNNTKVLKARIYLNTLNQNIKLINKFGKMITFKEGEILFLEKLNDYLFKAIVRPGKKFKKGNKFILENKISLEVVNYIHEGRIIKSSLIITKLFEKYGHLPLPPYIKFKKEKEKYYQSIFASEPGSIASPTASLHFTPTLIKKLKEKGCKIEYITLHIGLGTFKKVNIEDITKYDIHEEITKIDISIFEKIAHYKSNNNPIIAVGTTVTRTLESLPYLWEKLNDDKSFLKNFSPNTIKFWTTLTENINNGKQIIYSINLGSYQEISFKTKLYIYPGFKFKIIDQLITNFHLPKSSLLMLVAAFIGYENTMKIYRYAIEKKYKFFSFGDAMRALKGNFYYKSSLNLSTLHYL